MGELLIEYVLDKGALAPTKKYFQNGGWDFYANEDITLPASKLVSTGKPFHVGTKMWLTGEDILNLIQFSPAPITKVHTGVHIAVPKDHVSILFDRSSMGIVSYISHVAGVIDFGYTGEIIAGLVNFGKEDYHIKRGEKIIQMVFLETPLFLKWHKVDKLKETPRGDKGFGESSGK